jgi:hypothetical protein
LDYSQINSGKFRKNPSKFNVRDIVKRVMRTQMAAAKAKGVNLEA